MDVLRLKLKWVMGIRVAFVSLTLGVWIYLHLGRDASTVPAYYSLIITIFLLTIIYSLLINRIPNGPLLKVFAYIQIGIDILCESVLVAITGGVESPFSLLYIISITAASALLSRSGGLAAASTAAILYGVIVDLQYYQTAYQILLPPTWLSRTELTTPTIFYNLSINVVGFIMVGYLTGTLAEKLKSTGDRLEKKARALVGFKELHRCILESIESGVLTTDEQGHVTSFNRRAEEITGYLNAEVQGRCWWDIFSWPIVTGRKGLEVSVGPARFEEIGRRKDGGRYILGLSLSPLHQAGIRMGVVAVFQDITPLKKMEETIRRKEWLATIGEMSAGMAHEVRNPLAALSGAMQVLRKDLRPADANRPLLDLALRETERLNSIVTDFLQYARPGRLHLRSYNINELVDETLGMLERTAPYDSMISFVRDFEPDPVTAPLDPDHMRQVCWNLGLNACQSMPQGGTLTMSTRRTRSSAAGPETDSIEIVFADTGTGIAEEHLGKIFFPFFTTKQDGTGLGLSIVYRVLDEHGGSVHVDSVWGQGTRVRLLIPAGERVELEMSG
jgi:two-component system sensor histidine kinase PilS (NtrC family)